MDEARGHGAIPISLRYEKNPGHMSEVRVNADPERFLHWDKPLSEQHPDVQKAVRASIGNAQPVQLRDGRYSITHVQPDGSGRVLWDIAEASPEAAREMYSQWLSSSSGREIYQHLAIHFPARFLRYTRRYPTGQRPDPSGWTWVME